MNDPVRIVEEYLRLHMIPDPAEATAFNKARHKWVKKKFGPTYGEWLGGTPLKP